MTDHSVSKGLFTVRKLAALSGVSVRTLHHYDELGLLKPASVGSNGYRYYGREQLLRLQQILFHKDMGLSLEEIRGVLDAPGFDRAVMLRQHRQRVMGEAARLQLLLRTIDGTLAELDGGEPIGEQAMYRGFDPGAQARQEAWIVERYGKWGRLGIEERNRLLEGWSPADHERQNAEWLAIIAEFGAALVEGAAAEGERVQGLVRRLHACLSNVSASPVQRGGFLNIADIYKENPDARVGLDRHAPGLADYLARAMRTFCVATDPWPRPAPAARKARQRIARSRPRQGS